MLEFVLLLLVVIFAIFMRLVTIMEIEMRKVPLLAMSADDVVKAIRAFPAAVRENRELQDRLPNARAWYALQDEKGRWIFAPSKWAGYHGMTAERYMADSTTVMDGRKTEKRLQHWFTPLDSQSPEHPELQGALAAFLGEYGKQPNGVARISAISVEKSADHRDDLAELLVRVIRRLDTAQQARIRSALRV